MGNREVHEEPDLQCDVCGEYGAYDFYGDAICQKCIDENKSKSRVRRKVAQKKVDLPHEKPKYPLMDLDGLDGAWCFKGMVKELYDKHNSTYPVSRLTFVVTVDDYKRMLPYFFEETRYRIQPLRFFGVFVLPMLPRYFPVGGLREREIWLVDLREWEQTDYIKFPIIFIKGVGFDFV